MRARRVIGLLALVALVPACGGGGNGGSVAPPPPQPPPFTSVSQVKVSGASTFASGCDQVQPSGTLYPNTAVEPSLAVNPVNPNNLIAAWQQNRWSNGGAQGLLLASSVDGGMSWSLTEAAFSRCTGGNSGNAGDYARATDPWLSASPNGVLYALSLSFNGATLMPGSSSAMLVAQSLDGGVTWTLPIALIQDGNTVFNDKGSITADPGGASFVYAVWDRLLSDTTAPTYFARTTNGGSSWQPARSIYDPGPTAQTLGNQIVVRPGGVLLDVFTQIDTGGGAATASVRVITSPDQGTTWSAPVTVSDLEARGTSDPQTGAAVRDGSDLVSVSVGPAPAGIIYLVWQDSRFSGGKRDGIAMTQSADGGHTWTIPVQINGDAAVQAFTPTINVRSDGAIAVTYFDLRSDTVPGFFLADCWMVTSHDGGKTFHESHLSGPFDLNRAPLSDIDSGATSSPGPFLGDYQSLVSAPGVFLPFYVQTDPGTQTRSDAFISFPPSAAAVVAIHAQPARAGSELTLEARRHIMERTRLTQRQRLIGR
jgi:BNR repeat-like domain